MRKDDTLNKLEERIKQSLYMFSQNLGFRLDEGFEKWALDYTNNSWLAAINSEVKRSYKDRSYAVLKEVIPEQCLRFNTDCSRTRSNGSLKRSGHNQKQPFSNLNRFAAVISQFLADCCTLSFSKVYGAIPADFMNTLRIINPLHLQDTHEYQQKVDDRIWLELYG